MTVEAIAKDRADWLLDAVACSTQDKRFLRGDPEYDAVMGDAILLNGEKAIITALALAAATQRAKTPTAAECEASQSGGEAVTPKGHPEQPR